MTQEELKEKLAEIQRTQCETSTLEIKSAHKGCPKRLFDTLSSFSNQDEGGVILFGVDESAGYEEVGVYDAQALQVAVNSQCQQMQPIVRPLFTVLEKEGKSFVSAEIPGIDLSERPCYYRGAGRVRGARMRVGDSDEPMTEYEIYSYEAFRKKYQDDIRTVPRATWEVLNQDAVNAYIQRLKEGKQQFAHLPDETIRELMCMSREGEVTLSTVMLFCPYPQAFFPQLGIVATVLPGVNEGEVGSMGERFLDNQRIEGTIPEMLDAAIRFVRKNMKTRTIVNPEIGQREDRTEYPVTAVREAILNALVHRDYSLHTEGMPIQIRMYEDRLEIHNPGGLYGRISIDQLGKMQPDTRNPKLATALEIIGVTENRYSGIPTIRREMSLLGLREPQFEEERGSFIVRFYNHGAMVTDEPPRAEAEMSYKILLFCKTPRTRREISEYLGLGSTSYAIRTYVTPLVQSGRIRLSIPEKPGSSKQLFYTAQ